LSTVLLNPSNTAPSWLLEIPRYPGAKPFQVSAKNAAALGLNPAQYLVTCRTTPDPVPILISFYKRWLENHNWQMVQKLPLNGSEAAGVQLIFSNVIGGQAQTLIILLSTAGALSTNLRSIGIASQLPAGNNLVLLATRIERPGPGETTEPPTEGLPVGVGAKNMDFRLGDGWVTHAQITYPARQTQAFPTLILVHGSGRNDMDETLPEDVAGVPGGSKFFLPIAYALPLIGFAVVRYNKRGVIGLGPQLSDNPRWLHLAHPFSQYLADAREILYQVRKLPEVDRSRLVMLGHSEGTLVASLIAASTAGQHLAGLILMGILGFSGREVLQYQMVDRQVQQVAEFIDKDHDGLISAEDFISWLDTQNEKIKAANLAALFDPDPDNPQKYRFKPALDSDGDGVMNIAKEFRDYLMATTGMANFPQLNGMEPDQVAYFADLERHGSVTSVLPGYNKPVLMMNGVADIQTVISGARAADEALGKAGNTDHTLLTYPGLGHSFYPTHGVEQPLGPPQAKVLEDMEDWLKSHFL
jgi:pimeloyl-ACP methyl ester carboxylesterase